MNIRYQHPEFFIGLAILPLAALLFRYLISWKRSAAKKIGDPVLVSELTADHSPTKFLVKFTFAVLAIAAVVLAMVSPQQPGKMSKVERKGVDVMLALDVSNSMLAEDIKPNRLERAKQLILNVLGELDNDRVGLILFAGRAYMQMPLTLDHAAARLFVQHASPEVVPAQGTMISEALKMGASAFNTKERKYKSIVLITDGEDHDPQSLETANELAVHGVMVNTVGIGSTIGTPIPDPATGEYKKDELGNTVLSKLNASQLQQISAATGGIYISPEKMNEAAVLISRQLSAIESTAMEDAAFLDYTDYFQWFIAAALLMLVMEFFMPETKAERG